MDAVAFLPSAYRLEPHGDGVEKPGQRWADELICDINAFENACIALFDPECPLRTQSWTRSWVENQNPEDTVGLGLVRSTTGSVAGLLSMRGSNNDNPHLMFGDIQVLPDHRRQGVATALLAHYAQVAAADGRTMLLLGADDVREEADAFAASLGAAMGVRSHVNQLKIAEVPEGLIERWLAEPVERGTTERYELEWMFGPTTDARMADMIQLRTVLLNTAPYDDVPIDDVVVTPSDIRSSDDRTTASGAVRWLVFARERATGTAVAYTEAIVSDEDPRFVGQGATAVAPGHRGHGLGRWLKAAMIDRLLRERPMVEGIRTFNADSNEHMLAINHAMGFKPHKAAARWVLPVDDVTGWLEKRR